MTTSETAKARHDQLFGDRLSSSRQELGIGLRLTGNCFGDTVARDGLVVPTRELLTFAMLAAMGGADAQLRGHVTGNLNALTALNELTSN